jgi:hypothetical protein
MTDSIPAGKRIIVWRKHRVNAYRKRGFRTICEVLRELYRDADRRGDTLAMARAQEATDMAKRMQERLVHYSQHRETLVNTESGMAWIEKNKLLRLTDAEMALIREHRASSEKE